MLRSQWLRNLFDVNRTRQNRRRLSPQSRKKVRLMPESLEERLTPSAPTQTAGSYTDLVKAVAADTASDTNYVIQITNDFTFNSGGQVSISKLGAGSALTIEGQNGTNYTLTGNGNRLFNISGTGQSVTFADLTLTGGIVTSSNSGAQGGAIRAGGVNVTLSSVIIENNAVTGYQAEGGGIYTTGGGNLTIKNDSVIQSNNVTATNFAAGGGVNVGASSVVISDSVISKNSVTAKQGANGASPGADGATGGTADGGGLYVSGNSWTVTLTGDTLSGNKLTGGNGGNGAAGQNATGTNASGGNGGQGGQGGFASGGGAYFFAWSNVSSHLTISDDPNALTTNPSEFLDNSIQGGAGGNGGAGGTSTGTANNANGGNSGAASQIVGGGIFISAASGGTIQATINNTTFSGNTLSGARSGTGGAAGSGGTGNYGTYGNSGGGNSFGGGIALEKGVTATMKNSTVANNTISGTTDNVGGGIAEFGASLTLDHVRIQSNAGVGTSVAGGGVFESQGGNLTMQGGCVVQSNRSTGSLAQGGGVYILSPSAVPTIVTLRDTIVTDNSAQGVQGPDGVTGGADGGGGGGAIGGGLRLNGDHWTVTLTGVTLLGNSAVGGDGGKGPVGSNATGANAIGGNGGGGGRGGDGIGGAACFVGNSSCILTLIDDPSVPAAYPSMIINNLAQAGSGGSGGAGGASTGTANNSNGGSGGSGGEGSGGAIYLSGSGVNVKIGNTTFFGNKVAGGNGGSGGAAGTGGSGTAGEPGASPTGGKASGGGLDLEGGNITLVNNTVAKNTATAGSSNGGAGSQAVAIGGGILVEDFTAPAVFDNNTITQNTIRGGIQALGSGIYVPSSNLTLVNNLIQGNESLGSTANDLETFTHTLSNASNNFITSVNANAVSTTSNIIGNSQTQLGSVVGVSGNGKSSGGPIYYPLLPGTVSIGAGALGALNTIASVEGTTSANATDEIGGLRSSNGSIDLGAVQVVSSSPSAPVVTRGPTSQMVTAGANVSFMASASGATAVQWQVSTDGGKTFTNINGATNTTLMLHNVTAAMNGYEYDAVFTNSAGQVITGAATLTVHPAPPPPPPPVLNVPPLLAFLDSLLGGIETVNDNGTELITDSLFGIPLIVSTFDSTGNLVSVTIFGFNITFLFA